MIIKLSYPLKWPSGLPKKRQKSRPKMVCKPIKENLRLIKLIIYEMKLQDVRISSNLKISEDGEILGRPGSSDPGVAMYFKMKNDRYTLASDQFFTVRQNLQAITRALDGYRSIYRYNTKAHKIESYGSV